MAALTSGTRAPDFTLPSMDGKPFSLREALARGPVLAVTARGGSWLPSNVKNVLDRAAE